MERCPSSGFSPHLPKLPLLESHPTQASTPVSVALMKRTHATLNTIFYPIRTPSCGKKKNSFAISENSNETICSMYLGHIISGVYSPSKYQESWATTNKWRVSWPHYKSCKSKKQQQAHASEKQSKGSVPIHFSDSHI